MVAIRKQCCVVPNLICSDFIYETDLNRFIRMQKHQKHQLQVRRIDTYVTEGYILMLR